MKRIFCVTCLAMLILAMVLSTGCGSGDKKSGAIEKPPFVTGEDMDANGGADLNYGAGDNANTRYFAINDYYNMADDENLTIIEHYKPIQQTTEWTCGPSMASGVLNNFGLTQYSEKKCAIAAGSNDRSSL